MGSIESDQTYDVIIAGGGAAGCIIATRVAEADPSLRVLLIEAGKNNLDDPSVVNPGMYLSNLAPGGTKLQMHGPSPNTPSKGRQLTSVVGDVLGGGSSVNFMMYTRGQARDYDAWNAKGWDFNSLLPYFKRFESYKGLPEDVEYDRSVHGYDGPIQISHGTWAPKEPVEDFLQAGEAMGKKRHIDMGDFTSCDGYAPWPAYVSPDGKRQDVAHCYLHPLMKSGRAPNLHLLLETKASRVLFDDFGKANGVEVFPNLKYQTVLPAAQNTPQVIRATRLVVVSAGTLATPGILERSGIGSETLLRELSIPVISNLPGVGENYQDHIFVASSYMTNLRPSDTADEFIRGGFNIEKALAEGNLNVGGNALTHSGKIRPTAAEVATFGPDLRAVWEREYAADPARHLLIMGVMNQFLGQPDQLPPLAPGAIHPPFVSLEPVVAYGDSRGSVHIESRDVHAAPHFDARWFARQSDVDKLVWGYKHGRDLFRRTNAFAGEAPAMHPAFPAGSAAAVVDRPVAPAGGFRSAAERAAVPRIAYTAADDAAIEKWVRDTAIVAWHFMGTCKMAPRADGGVVDERLAVHGVSGLRVADMSICPAGVGANTYNTALMIGERASDLILEDLGIKA